MSKRSRDKATLRASHSLSPMSYDLGFANLTAGDDNGSIESNISNAQTDFRYLYRNLATYFLVWYLAVVIVAGFFGAAFCLLFLSFSRLFPKMILIWLISICVGDLMILLLDALRMGLKIWVRWDIRDANVVACRMHNFFSNYFFYFSAYMQTCMSLQRLYFVCRPLQARSHLTMRRVTIAWAVVVLALALPHLPYVMVWHIADSGDCEPTDVWYYYVTTLLDLSLWGIIPLVFMTLSTFVISIKIFSFKDAFAAASDDRSQSLGPPRHSLRPGRRHGGNDNAGHVTKLLVAMNLFYMVTTYPLLIYLMHLNFGLQNKVGITIPQPVHKFYYYLLRSLCYLNSSVNWVFYCAAGKLFRRRARLLLLRFIFCRLCFRRNGDSSHGCATGWDSSQIPLNSRTARPMYTTAGGGECASAVLPRGQPFRFPPPGRAAKPRQESPAEL